jgi:hypothetical protein
MSNPGDGLGVLFIVPAVPSPTGVADVFAMMVDGIVQAITSDGTVAWTTNVRGASDIVPDFKGGLSVQTSTSIYKLDGITGQPYPAYAEPTSFAWGVLNGTDGTVYSIINGTRGTSVVAINPITGAQNFSVATGIISILIAPTYPPETSREGRSF